MKRLALVLVLFWAVAAQAQLGQFIYPTPASGGGGIVVFDAADTANANSGGSVLTENLTTITVGSGANRGLVVAFQIDGTTALSGQTVVWDNGGTNQSMTLIGSEPTTGAGGIVYFYGLVAPTSGAKTLTVTWSSPSVEINIYAVSFTGVNQAGSTSSFQFVGANNGNSTAMTTTAITSATGDYVVGAFLSASTAAISAVSNTAVPAIDNAQGSINTAANRVTGSASVTLTGTTSTGLWAAAAVNVLHN